MQGSMMLRTRYADGRSGRLVPRFTNYATIVFRTPMPPTGLFRCAGQATQTLIIVVLMKHGTRVTEQDGTGVPYRRGYR